MNLVPNPAPTFAQPERRSFLVPILLALAAIAVAAGLGMYFFPATTVDIAHVHTDMLPTETVMKGSSIVGLEERNQTLFVASTIRIDNRLRVPIYLDDFDLTFTNPEDAELTAKAVAKADVPDLETNFPGVKPLYTTPLPLNTVIDPGKSAQGTVLFSLRIPKATWDARKSAVVKVSLYHQPAVYVTIPK